MDLAKTIIECEKNTPPRQGVGIVQMTDNLLLSYWHVVAK